MRALLVQRHGRWLRHLLLAMTLMVVVLGIVGMHQLSVGHDVAIGPAASVAHPESFDRAVSSGDVVPVARAALPDGDAAGGMTDGGIEGACPDCADHQMALGSCLLALTLLVLGWLLAPPRPAHIPPFLLPRLAPTAAASTAGRLVPPLSLVELSLRRT